MALLESYDRKEKVHLLSEKVYYATAISWRPRQHFYVTVDPDYQIRLEHQKTQITAIYYGPCTTLVDSKGFMPDKFTVIRKPPAVDRDVYPQRRDLTNDDDDEVSKRRRAFIIEEHHKDEAIFQAWRK